MSNQNVIDSESPSKTRFKTVLLGDSRVGKTSIKRSYLGLDFIDNYEMTLGVEISTKTMGKNVLQIWDLAGQRGFNALFSDHFANAEAAVVVFDITNPKSFENLSRWIEMITIQKKELLPTIIVGNKSDLRGRSNIEVSHQTAMDYAQYLSNNSIYEIPYIEASALTGLNISYIFEHLIYTLNEISKHKN